MQLVERGEINLDAPVSQYIPDFTPHNPFDKPITLRELMAHRSGLVREPPVGNYFDDSGPSLQQTIRSLNSTTLVYAPGSHTKYSNAGVATAGYVLETLKHQPYAEYLQKSVLAPLGMNDSSFQPEPKLMENLATGYMWNYDGLHITTPTFPLGEGPCGSLYTTVIDLGKFISALFSDGRGSVSGPASPDAQADVGAAIRSCGFNSLRTDLGSACSSSTAISQSATAALSTGFATQLEAIPDAKLGVVVIASAR